MLVLVLVCWRCDVGVLVMCVFGVGVVVGVCVCWGGCFVQRAFCGEGVLWRGHFVERVFYGEGILWRGCFMERAFAERVLGGG
jgi:hypothetical protein